MKKLTFAINYRKPKSEYTSDSMVEICIRYEYFDENLKKKKIKNQSCGIKCRLVDWNKDWHKYPERLPILKTDPDYIAKNKKLFNIRKKLLVQDFSINEERITKEEKSNLILDSKVPDGPIEKKWTNNFFLILNNFLFLAI